MGKLMIEVLKWWKSVEFIRVKGPREAWSLGLDQKIVGRGGQDLTVLENLPGGDGNAWNWLIHKAKESLPRSEPEFSQVISNKTALGHDYSVLRKSSWTASVSIVSPIATIEQISVD